MLAALCAAGCGTVTKTVIVTRTGTVTKAHTVTAQTATTAAPPCTGGQLSGTFALVPGSAGAGQVGYVLTVTNVSTRACYVFGIPQVQLLAASGAPLPTHLEAARSRTAQPTRIVLVAGARTEALARFSADIPGPGDSGTGTCQPKAYTLRFTPDGGGRVDAPIRPPTSVCEQGRLSFLFFGVAGG